MKRELAEMAEAERKKIRYEFALNKDKTILRGKTTLALLKKSFDWAFATNQDEIDLDHIIPTYEGRWRIETGFRVQDEARPHQIEVQRYENPFFLLCLPTSR